MSRLARSRDLGEARIPISTATMEVQGARPLKNAIRASLASTVAASAIAAFPYLAYKSTLQQHARDNTPKILLEGPEIIKKVPASQSRSGVRYILTQGQEGQQTVGTINSCNTFQTLYTNGYEYKGGIGAVVCSSIKVQLGIVDGLGHPPVVAMNVAFNIAPPKDYIQAEKADAQAVTCEVGQNTSVTLTNSATKTNYTVDIYLKGLSATDQLGTEAWATFKVTVQAAPEATGIKKIIDDIKKYKAIEFIVGLLLFGVIFGRVTTSDRREAHE